MMPREEALKALTPHARRPIRAFIERPGPDPKTELAFWEMVYHGVVTTSHETARAVEQELMACSRPVQDVMNGWRPEALGAQT